MIQQGISPSKIDIKPDKEIEIPKIKMPEVKSLEIKKLEDRKDRKKPKEISI
ncbi:hypothetical protein LCGC14_0498780, partial [marine sediment metagenome]